MHQAVISFAIIFFTVLIPLSLTPDLNAQTIYRTAEQLNADGVEKLGLKEYSSAVDLFARSTRLKPDFSDAYVNLGTAHYLAGRPEEALGYLKKGVELDPNLPQGHNQLAVVWAELKKYDAAADHLKKALKLKADYPLAMRNLATVYLHKGDLKQATAAFEKARALDPSHAETRVSLGLLYAKRSQFAEAEAEFKNVLGRRPSDESANLALLQTYLLKNDRGAALDIYHSFKTANTPLAEKMFRSITQGSVVFVPEQ